MSRVRWSDNALRDLSNVYEYLSQNNPFAAEQARYDLVATANGLADFPLMGRQLDRRGPEVRGLSVPRWKKILVYRVRDNTVEIAAIIDPRQDT